MPLSGFGPFVGTGSTITFGTSNFTANIKSSKIGTVKRTTLDSTYLGTTTAKTFISGSLYDPGELEMTIQAAPNKGGTIPIAGATETCTFANGGSGFSVSCFFNEFDITIQTEEIMEATVKCKFTGSITWNGQS